MNAPFPSLVELLSDRRVSVEAADGRQALARSERRYDVIEVDALYLTSAGSGNLYSVEFFELCARRLKPGGLVCSQKPSRRVGLTFAEALPHVLDFGNMVIGSNEEIPIDLRGVGGAARARPASPGASTPRRSRRSASASPRSSAACATPRPASASTATSSRATSSAPPRAGNASGVRGLARATSGEFTAAAVRHADPLGAASAQQQALPVRGLRRLSFESAFSIAKVAIFSTAQGKCASLRLR